MGCEGRDSGLGIRGPERLEVFSLEPSAFT